MNWCPGHAGIGGSEGADSVSTESSDKRPLKIGRTDMLRVKMTTLMSEKGQ